MALADDLRETLLTAHQAIGPDAHRIHVARLQLVWHIVQWATREQAERAVDLEQRDRR